MSGDNVHAVRPSARICDEVLAERVRQIEGEAWGTSHDDEHVGGELALAASCYAYMGHCQSAPERVLGKHSAERMWPWPGSFKPKDARRDLIRAGALIVAEIERLDRLSGSDS